MGPTCGGIYTAQLAGRLGGARLHADREQLPSRIVHRKFCDRGFLREGLDAAAWALARVDEP